MMSTYTTTSTKMYHVAMSWYNHYFQSTRTKLFREQQQRLLQRQQDEQQQQQQQEQQPLNMDDEDDQQQAHHDHPTNQLLLHSVRRRGSSNNNDDDDANYFDNPINRQHFLWSILMLWFGILEIHRSYYNHHNHYCDNRDYHQSLVIIPDYHSYWKKATTTTTQTSRTTCPTRTSNNVRNYGHEELSLMPMDYYDWTKSTEENYNKSRQSPSHDGHDDGSIEFCGKYQSIRQTLDYTYHGQYFCERQIVQDTIIDTIIQEGITRRTTKASSRISQSNDTHNSDSHSQQWVVFTAGIPGSGKTYTVQNMLQENKIPYLNNDETITMDVVTIDPDVIRTKLPEYDTYIEMNPTKMGELTQKEVGLVTEIATQVALFYHGSKYNVIVDGSLSNYSWYIEYIQQLRDMKRYNDGQDLYSNQQQKQHKLNVGLIYVTAPLSVIYQRIAERAMQTGRIVPEHVMSRAIQQVPKSVQQLKDHVDCFMEIENNFDRTTHHHNVVNDDEYYTNNINQSFNATSQFYMKPIVTTV